MLISALGQKAFMKKEKKKRIKKDEKLKIVGNFSDVLKVAVSGNPKPTPKKK